VYLVRRRTGHNEYYALKTLSIQHVVGRNQVEHVHNEKKVLEHIQHPFIVELYVAYVHTSRQYACRHWTFHDSKCIYMLFDFIAGGELFSYLRAAGRFR
jgi:serine/threonine protein kinase